jgi:hypothetical protein
MKEDMRKPDRCIGLVHGNEPAMHMLGAGQQSAERLVDDIVRDGCFVESDVALKELTPGALVASLERANSHGHV